jgi:hypothetical protein
MIDRVIMVGCHEVELWRHQNIQAEMEQQRLLQTARGFCQ